MFNWQIWAATPYCERHCEFCKETYTVVNSRKKQRFCSIKCRTDASRNKDRETQCPVCDKTFSNKQTHQVTCSKECGYINRKINAAKRYKLSTVSTLFKQLYCHQSGECIEYSTCKQPPLGLGCFIKPQRHSGYRSSAGAL